MKNKLNNVKIAMALVFVFVSACQKKSNNSTTSTGAGGNGGSGNTSTPITWQIILTKTQTQLPGNTIINDSSALVTLFNTGAIPTPSNCFFGGNFSLNNTPLSYTSGQYNNCYSSNGSLSVNISQTSTVSCVGNTTVSAFTQTFMPNFPIYSGYNLIADTFSLASGVTVAIGGLSNFPSNNALSVSIYNNYGSIMGYKTMSGSTGTLSFLSSDLIGAASNTNKPITISIEPVNFFYFNFGNQTRYISFMASFKKTVYLKP
ncbi:MAG: hypothetical protein JSU07_03230 [Bacteroidetes bacterium]|nr:hypothetical protein [Bacteroidota bacterium]